MKTLFLYDEITLPAVQRLIERMEEEAPGEEIRVYIRSGGGEVSAGDVLIDYLNRCPYQVELVAAWELSSTAFNVFFRSRVARRTVLEPTTAQVHLCSWDTDVRRIATEGCWEYVANRQLEQIDAEYLDWLRQLGLTEEQVGVVARKADLHLSTGELRQIARRLEGGAGTEKPSRLRTQRKQSGTMLNYKKGGKNGSIDSLALYRLHGPGGRAHRRPENAQARACIGQGGRGTRRGGQRAAAPQARRPGQLLHRRPPGGRQLLAAPDGGGHRAPLPPACPRPGRPAGAER